MGIQAFLSFFFISCCLWLSAEDGDLLNRKQQKEIMRIFGEGIEVRCLVIPVNENSTQPYRGETDELYELCREKQLLGYLISTRAKGRFDYFDYSVIFSSGFSVEGILVTEYRSTQGAGICNRKWLGQFRGYSGGVIRLGKEIDGISGSTISAGSIVSDVQRCHNLLVTVLGLPADP